MRAAMQGLRASRGTWHPSEQWGVSAGDSPQLTFERLHLVTICKETGMGAEDRDYWQEGGGGIVWGAVWRWWEAIEPGLSGRTQPQGPGPVGVGWESRTEDGSQLGA